MPGHLGLFIWVTDNRAKFPLRGMGELFYLFYFFFLFCLSFILSFLSLLSLGSLVDGFI